MIDKVEIEMRDVLSIDPKKFIVASNGSLFIHKVEYRDKKIYQCVSSNPGLSKNVTANLDVYGEF